MAGWLEHGAESAGSINCKEILDKIFRQHSAVWSWLVHW